MTDDQGQPQQSYAESRTATDAEQVISLNTQQAAQQLGVDSRTVRRWINEGLHTAMGDILRLKARQVRSARGPEWQIYQSDLDEFRYGRDHAATAGMPADQIPQPIEESQSLALTNSIEIISAELERRSLALAEAQATIERLAHEAGREAGRNEILERELTSLHQRVSELEIERDQARAEANKPPRRVRLLPWQH